MSIEDLKLLDGKTVADKLFRKTTRDLQSRQIAFCNKNDNLHDYMASMGIIHRGELYSGLFKYERATRTRKQKARWEPARQLHESLELEFSEFLADKKQHEVRYSYIANYFINVFTTFANPDQIKEFIPELLCPGLYLASTRSLAKESDEFVAEFKRKNGKYLTEIKALMLQNLITGDN